MHATSLRLMRSAINDLQVATSPSQLSVLDVGARVVDGQKLSYSTLFSAPPFSYVGMDVERGQNVDVVVKLPYDWRELQSNSFDLVISGQALEHVPFFWDVFQEMARVLKPGGALVVIVPSKGAVHRYPVDCYRFHPDGLIALAARYGLTTKQVVVDEGSYWGDVMLVAQKQAVEMTSSATEFDINQPHENLISRVARPKKLIDVLLSLVSVLIGDRAFMSVIGVRNRLRTSTARRARP